MHQHPLNFKLVFLRTRNLTRNSVRSRIIPARLQSKFFETFAGPFTKRGLLLKFLLLGGGSLLAYVSASASPDLLPIKKGPQQPPVPGPRGKI